MLKVTPISQIIPTFWERGDVIQSRRVNAKPRLPEDGETAPSPDDFLYLYDRTGKGTVYVSPRIVAIQI